MDLSDAKQRIEELESKVQYLEQQVGEKNYIPYLTPSERTLEKIAEKVNHLITVIRNEAKR